MLLISAVVAEIAETLSPTAQPAFS